jgi:hypothetical protein
LTHSPTDEVVSTDVRVVDELGLIVTKSESVGVKKRERDAFDIALAITEARDPGALLRDARALEDDRPEVYSVLGKIETAFSSGGVAERVAPYLPEPEREPESQRIVLAVQEFLRQVGIDRGLGEANA